MNFMFSWQEQYLTRSLRSLVRYCSCHSNIKFISSRHRVISSISAPNDIKRNNIKKRLDNTACVIATCMYNAMDHIKGWKLCRFLRYKLTAGLSSNCFFFFSFSKLKGKHSRSAYTWSIKRLGFNKNIIVSYLMMLTSVSLTVYISLNALHKLVLNKSGFSNPTVSPEKANSCSY